MAKQDKSGALHQRIKHSFSLKEACDHSELGTVVCEVSCYLRASGGDQVLTLQALLVEGGQQDLVNPPVAEQKAADLVLSVLQGGKMTLRAGLWAVLDLGVAKGLPLHAGNLTTVMTVPASRVELLHILHSSWWFMGIVSTGDAQTGGI